MGNESTSGRPCLLIKPRQQFAYCHMYPARQTRVMCSGNNVLCVQRFKGYDADPQGHPDIEQSKYVQSYIKMSESEFMSTSN